MTATDPDGQLLIEIADVQEAVRYRFETGSADYLVCGRCGVYVAAVVSAFSGAVASVNVNVLDDATAFSQTPQVVRLDGESAHERRIRRAEEWTVTTIIVPGADVQ